MKVFLNIVLYSWICKNLVDFGKSLLDMQEFSGISIPFYNWNVSYMCRWTKIGSISKSIEAVKMLKEADWGVMTSPRSVETMDSFIADLVVGSCTVNSAF